MRSLCLVRGVSLAAARVIVEEEEDADDADAVVMRDAEGGRACPLRDRFTAR